MLLRCRVTKLLTFRVMVAMGGRISISQRLWYHKKNGCKFPITVRGSRVFLSIFIVCITFIQDVFYCLRFVVYKVIVDTERYTVGSYRVLAIA